jgi:hypothetical protein
MKNKYQVTVLAFGLVVMMFSLVLNAQSTSKNTSVAENWKLGVALYTLVQHLFPNNWPTPTVLP